MRPAKTWREVPGLAAPRTSRLFYPFSRSSCWLLFAIGATRRSLAQRHSQRGWHRLATRPIPCGSGCGCPCPSPRTDAAQMVTAAAQQSTPTATTMPCALAQAGSPAKPSRWSRARSSRLARRRRRPVRSPAPRLRRVWGQPARWGPLRRPHLGSRPHARGSGPALRRHREAGRRWNTESRRLIAQLVRLRSQRAPAALRSVVAQGWLRPWWCLLSVALQSTLAATLPREPESL